MPFSISGFNISPKYGLAFLLLFSFVGYKLFKRWKAGGKVPQGLLNKTDFHGDVVVITGANSGIGFETAKQLALLNARVIVTCRDEKKVQDTVTRLNALVKSSNKKVSSNSNTQSRGGNVEGVVLELSSLKSVKKAASQISTLIGEDRLAILLLNAGVVTEERKQTEDGYEFMFQVNYLSHFLLTQLLLNKILKDGSRVIQVASRAHTRYPNMKIKYNELNTSTANNSIVSQYEWYAHSKLAQVLFSKSLDKIIKEKKSNAVSVSLHPGVVYTSIFRSLPSVLLLLIDVLSSIAAKTTEEGAQTSIYCSISDKIKSGEYYSDCAVERAHSLSRDQNAIDELYQKSLEMVKDYL